MKLFVVRRQTVLFSATQTRNVEDLARVSLKESPLYVGVDDDRETSTVEGLEQVLLQEAKKLESAPNDLSFSENPVKCTCLVR